MTVSTILSGRATSVDSDSETGKPTTIKVTGHNLDVGSGLGLFYRFGTGKSRWP